MMIMTMMMVIVMMIIDNDRNDDDHYQEDKKDLVHWMAYREPRPPSPSPQVLKFKSPPMESPSPTSSLSPQELRFGQSVMP